MLLVAPTTAKATVSQSLLSKRLKGSFESVTKLARVCWNTPTQNVGRSPAQRLFNRRTKTLLSTTKNVLKPQFAENDLDKIKFDKKRQAFYHDKSAKLLPQFEEGDAVRIKPFKVGQKSWQMGIILRQLDDKSYDVVGKDGNVIRRNRVHLRHTKERPLDQEP